MIAKVFPILFALCFFSAVEQNHTDYKVYRNLKKAQRNSDKAYALQLAGKELATVPESIIELKQLIELDLSNNTFSSFPEIVLDLENLKILKLNRCGLNNIPVEIDKLEKLEELWLMHNKIEEIPKSIYNLPHLRLLVLIDNLISTSEIKKINTEIGDRCFIIHHHEFHINKTN
ncbi:leucine-rich repeat domain-containing protein [Puteibacter caeruleilacunae]|nr:leucine-rich repeat domain-containing protein [Puteibacter caeruleilacunae]